MLPHLEGFQVKVVRIMFVEDVAHPIQSRAKAYELFRLIQNEKRGHHFGSKQTVWCKFGLQTNSEMSPLHCHHHISEQAFLIGNESQDWLRSLVLEDRDQDHSFNLLPFAKFWNEHVYVSISSLSCSKKCGKGKAKLCTLSVRGQWSSSALCQFFHQLPWTVSYSAGLCHSRGISEWC